MSQVMTQNKVSVLPIVIFAWTLHLFVDVMIGFWPVYKTLMNMDLAVSGMIVAASAFIGEGSQLFFGPLSDKGYRKQLMVAGLAMTTLSAFLSSSTNYLVLFFLYLITCIGSGCFHPSAAGLVNTLVPSKRGLLMSFFASGGAIGMATSQIIFSNSYHFFDGKTAFLCLPPLLFGAIFLFFKLPKNPKPQLVHENRLQEFTRFFKMPELRLLYFAQVANQSILWGTIFILPDVLKTMDFPDWISYGGGHLFFILGSASFMIPAGYFADRYSPRLVLLVSSVVASVTFYFLLFTGGLSITLTLASLFVMGAALGLFNPVGVSLGIQYAPEKPGAISAFLMGMVWCLSEALGPGGVGILSAMFDDYAPVKALALIGLFFIPQFYSILSLPKEASIAEASPA